MKSPETSLELGPAPAAGLCSPGPWAPVGEEPRPWVCYTEGRVKVQAAQEVSPEGQQHPVPAQPPCPSADQSPQHGDLKSFLTPSQSQLPSAPGIPFAPTALGFWVSLLACMPTLVPNSVDFGTCLCTLPPTDNTPSPVLRRFLSCG